MPSHPVIVPAAVLLNPLFLDNHRGETAGVLDVHGLHVAVQLLLGILLVISSPGNSHTESVGNALDATLPDLLIQLGIEAHIGGTLQTVVSISFLCYPAGQPSQASWTSDQFQVFEGLKKSYHGLGGEVSNLLDGTRSALLESDAV